MTDEDFDERFNEAQAEAASAAESGFAAMSEKLHSLVSLQSAEISRLRKIIADVSTTPARAPVHVAIATSEQDRRLRRDVVALAEDKSMWVLMDVPSHPDVWKHHEHGWMRIPPLPSPADEMERGK